MQRPLVQQQVSGSRQDKTRSNETSWLVSVAIWICICICGHDRHQNLIISLLAHCQSSPRISCKSVHKFLRQVANRQTDNDDYISSLTDVLNAVNTLSCFQCFGRKALRPVKKPKRLSLGHPAEPQVTSGKKAGYTKICVTGH